MKGSSISFKKKERKKGKVKAYCGVNAF